MAARKPKTEEEKRRELQIAAQNRARKDAAREALQSNITNAPLFQATQKITESQPKYQQAAKKVEQKTGVNPTRVSSGNKSSGSSSSRSSGSSRSTGIPQNLRADTYDATMNRIQTAARTRANRLKELDTLTNNSVAWHFADAAGKEALRKANDAIRARYGLLFDEATGMTSTPEGENLSENISTLARQEGPGIQARNTLDNLFARSNEAWSDSDNISKETSVKMLENEMERILAQYGITYTDGEVPKYSNKTANDDNAIQKLREAGADNRVIELIEKNIEYRNNSDRLGQSWEAVWKRAVAGIPSLVETAQQQAANVEESRSNPEYVKLETRKQQLESQLTSMPSTNYDGSLNPQYLEIYNELQDINKQMEALDVDTPVDPNAWSQTMLREADEAQANATAGLSPVPKFLLNQGINIAGNTPAIGASFIPGAGPAISSGIIAGSAAGQKSYELNAQGVSPDESLGRGVLSGAIEAATERVPLDSFVKLFKQGGAGAIKNILRQYGIEASEEGISYTMNALSDYAAADPNATFSLQELGEAMAGGGFSGGIFGGIGTAGNRISNRIRPTLRTAGENATSTNATNDLANVNSAQESQTNSQQTAAPDTINIGDTQVERGAGQITSPTAALTNDPLRVNAQNIGFTPLNLESTLNRLNPMSTAATQAMRNVQQVYPTQRVQPTLQTVQPQRIQPTLQGTPSMNALRQAISPESSVGAATTGFDPYTNMANQYGTIEPGENPARIVDVPKSTDGSNRVRRVARTAMEASITPEEMVPALEQNIVNGLFSYNPRTDKAAMDSAIKTVSDKGFNGSLDQWDDVVSGRRSATKDDMVLAEMLYSTAAQTGNTGLAMELLAEIAAEGTRAGQTSQAIRLLKRITPDGKLYYIRKAVDNLQKDLDESRGNKAPQLKIDEELASRLLTAQNEADANAAMDAIYDDVANQLPKTFGDRLNAWRYFAMLGNPRTHIRNVVGNIVYQIPTRVSNKISATLQRAFVPGEQRTRSVIRNRTAKDFAKSDYKEMKNVLAGNAYTSEMSEIQRRKKLFPGVIQKPMDFFSNALDAEDLFFKKHTYINSLADFLTARGADVNNLDPNVLEQARTHAIEDAKRATFQDASALADAIGKIENKNKATKLVIGGLLPFKRTPINIAKRGFELSPLGLIKGLTVDLNKVRNGTMTATDAIDHISQGLTGTSLAVLGYFLASNGILSASSPENDKERNFEAAQGSQEYAINIGPYSYTIDWAAPAALPMFVGAEFYNALTAKYDDEEQAFKQATDALSRLFEPMINMTMLSGISSTIQSATYSQTNPLFSIAGNIAQNYAGQVVPTLFGQIARTIDDTRRTTYADKDSWVPDSIQTFLQRQANKIPGLSQNQPAYTDVWGRPDTTENGWLRAFENFLSPGYIGNRNSSDAENALRELYNTTGDTAVLPSKPQKSYTIDGVEHNLTADQWLRLSNAKGQTALNAITALTQSGAYQSMSDQEKVNAVKDVYDYASAVAANQVYQKELEGTIKTVHDSGIDPGLYYAYKEMEDTLNESVEGYEARDQVFNTIRSDSSLTEEQKNQLYHTLLIQGTSDSQWEKYQEISDTVTAEEYVDAMIQSQAIKAYGDTLEEGRATAEATEFSYYLDAMGYDGTKRSALEDTFKFYNMFPAEPSNYTFDMMRENGSQREKDNVDAIEQSGLSAAQYMQIKTLTGDATWTNGETGAKLKAYGKIVSENTENYDQYAAVMHALGYKNIDDAYTGAGSLPDVAEATSQVSRSANPTEEVGVNPVAAGPGVRLGSEYGYRKAPTEGASTFHEGNDIPAPMGTPVVAYKSGTVSFVGDSGSGGNMVQIDHPDGTKSVYLHLQDGSFQVSPGQTVSQGQQIANVGSTGISTGPHLDFRIMVNGKYVDPQTYYPGY
ncbi:MAG TPA: peptidoglycan DD-metalloendopeptidase family protein [Candidatus Butyricicoccus avicola]|nr:peptidoglycan DD-metalloendopeptidase family protein [Candidatus Butyricicoccus avicola]